MTTLRDDLGYMRDAANDAIRILGDLTPSDLGRNREKQAAVCYLIAVVGESANRIKHREEHYRYPSVPWELVISTRNAMIHRHHSLDMAKVVGTVTVDFPQLITAIDAILQDLP